jgi:hypothetical protein
LRTKNIALWKASVILIKFDNMWLFINDCPAALKFYSQVIAMHGDPEKAALSPMSAVAISANPILHSIFFAPSHN